MSWTKNPFFVFAFYSPLPAATIQFAQTSINDLDASPIAAVSSLAFVESDLSYETTTAPAAFSNLRFTHWTNESSPGTAYRDAWGRSLNPAAFTLTQNTTATAHYLPATRDSDSDNVPDWFEIEFYGTLANSAASDTDSDGFNLLTEFSSGTSPLFGDSTSPGGIAYADSGMVTVNLAGYPTYTLTSNPPGTVNQSAVVTPGTVITTPDLSANATFGSWFIDGIRQADAWGAAYPSVSFTMAGTDRSGIAHLFPGDTDSDGIPDAYEQYYYGSLANPAESDTDGDGLDLVAERTAGTSPLFGDSTSPGGIAYADSGMVTVNLAGYATYSLTSNPPGTVSQSAVVTPGTVVTTPDLSANAAFGYWLIDGVRQADAWGAAYPAVSFTMAGTDRTGVAHLFPGDTDTDGVPDAYEQYYYGTLANPADTDSDGDGFNLLAERSAGTSPLFGDSSSPGGIAWAQSALLTVDTNDPPAASPATYTRLTGTPLRIRIPALLAASTSDPDGHTLTVSSVGPSTQGANVRISGSSILYSPTNNQDDSFPYTVRDPGGLTATSTITVQVLSPAGKIGTFSLNSSGQPVMQFAGIPNFRYAIERSPDLATWQTVHTITAPAAGTFSYTDPSPPSGSMYYRMRYLP